MLERFAVDEKTFIQLCLQELRVRYPEYKVVAYDLDADEEVASMEEGETRMPNHMLYATLEMRAPVWRKHQEAALKETK